jgi:hypothetical protein
MDIRDEVTMRGLDGRGRDGKGARAVVDMCFEIRSVFEWKGMHAPQIHYPGLLPQNPRIRLLRYSTW